MTITTSRLIDATEYELTRDGKGAWEWTEDGTPLGVRIELTDADGMALVKVISHETKGYLLLTEQQIEKRLRVAIDVMQFAENYNQDQWPFDELCDVLNAVDRDYGFAGQSDDLFIWLGFGMHLHKEDVGYSITDADGMTYYAGTINGLQNLYSKVVAQQIRRQIGWSERLIKKQTESQK